MKNWVKGLTYAVAILMFFGCLTTEDFTGSTAIAFLLVEVQCILTLIYIDKK